MATDQKHDIQNHGDVFDAASVVRAFFEASYAMVKDYGDFQLWHQTGHAQAAATLTNACVAVYVAQLQGRQRKAKKRTP